MGTQMAEFTVRLGWHGEEGQDLSAVRATLFGELVKLAAPVIEHYHSDLFHDARWIEEHVDGAPMSFDFVARPCGTYIGVDVEAMREALVLKPTDRAYRVAITHDRLEVVATITELSV